ncbi:alpha/beta fold hydrolase [Rhodococcus sp. HNM0569]|uniref:alpha/beta fold hydrolase n=1 Tax=Rhodococcus sp. HNM0569 TaxID=2716340 RepID=UPI00146EEC8B|nr:alpha/beta fold hydrolase [Rhodococcus sp. HNM0569]NLU84617.1 alpha/beta fold hydrolase [Rhodococcus sp. HNM0569]
MNDRLDSYERDGLRFDVRDSGPASGPTVVLLHGFPQDSRSWDAVAERLGAKGFRTVAPDQRGYSDGARPRRRRDYTLDRLAADVVALIDRIGSGPVHLVGHDWGAAVAWAVAADHPDKVRTLTAVSVPHPAAFAKAAATSTQGLKSWYMLAFQVPWLPERLLGRPDTAAWALGRTGQQPDAAARDADAMRDRSRARGALAWYRALPFASRGAMRARVQAPTLMVWSDGDTAVGRQGPERTAAYVDGPFHLEVLRGVSHWIPDEAPEELARLIVQHTERP